jgi:hypothetical protein
MQWLEVTGIVMTSPRYAINNFEIAEAATLPVVISFSAGVLVTYLSSLAFAP